MHLRTVWVVHSFVHTLIRTLQDRNRSAITRSTNEQTNEQRSGASWRMIHDLAARYKR
jgi:hypothetical protein